MGTMRFRVFPTERITAEMIQQAYLSGIDRVSWPARASVEGGELILQRSVSDSANLHVPWRVEGHGLLTLTSASLIERAEPYLLPLELARGTVVQVRNQLSEWQMIGLAVPEAVHARLATAVKRLSWASVEQGDAAVSAGHAEEALRAALDAANLLAAAYAEQAIVVRRRNEGTHFGLLAGDLGTTLLDDYTSRQFLRSFNAAELPICWRDTETTEGHMTWVVNDKQVEWCRKHGLKILAGPLAAARSAIAARLALAVRGRLRERAGMRLGVHPRRRRAISRQGRLLDLRRTGQRRRGVGPLRARAAAAGRAQPSN